MWYFPLLAVLLFASCGFFEDAQCMYGGPGCGWPYLELLCQESLDRWGSRFGEDGTLQKGRKYVAQFDYADDTGLYKTSIISLEVNTPILLSATREADDYVTLEALDVGDAKMTTEVKGWEGKKYQFAIQILEEIAVHDAGQRPEPEANVDAARPICRGIPTTIKPMSQ